MSKNIKIIFGAAPFGGWTAEQNQGYLDILTRHNVVDIDTAYIYVCPRPAPPLLELRFGLSKHIHCANKQSHSREVKKLSER